MPLQIRRGTTAQRLSTTPLPGEPIYDTDLQIIFIGNGVTPGGTSAQLGITTEDAQDAVGQMFVDGVHKNIVFRYNGFQDAANRIDVELDLQNYDGEISASAFRGPIFADDSSLIIDSVTKNIIANSIEGDLKGNVLANNSNLLVDAVNNAINLDGTVKGDVIPDQNELYDLGSNTNRFRDLYLSGNSLYLGSAQLTSVGSTIVLPAGSTIEGVPISAIVEGTNYKINIVSEDSSSIMVNSDTNEFFGDLTGDVTGNLTGDVTGNLTGDVTGNLTGDVTGNLTGDVTGNLTGDVTGNLTGDVTGNLTGDVTGNLTGDVTGNLTGDVKGSIFADNSSIIINAIDSSINLDGTVKGNVVPDQNELYDLGSNTNRFRDLYLSGNSLNLGAALITAVGSAIELPAGSTVAGLPIGSGSGTGDGVVEGSNYKINIVSGDSSSIMVNSDTGEFFGNLTGNVLGDLSGNLTGNVIGSLSGDVKGSVFADDSSIIIDAVDKAINIPFITSPENIIIRPTGSTLIESECIIGSASLGVNGNLNIIRNQYVNSVDTSIQITNSHNDQFVDSFYFKRTRGTATNYSAVQQDDQLGRISFVGWDGTDFIEAGSIRCNVTSVSPGIIETAFGIDVQNATGGYDNIVRLLNSGRLILGSALAGDTSQGSIELINRNQVSSPHVPGQSIIVRQFFDGVNANRLGATRARGTPDTPTSIQQNDQIFSIQCMGYDGGNYRNSSAIRFICHGPVSTGIIPGSIEFQTANLSGVMTRRVILDETGMLTALFGITADVTGDVKGSVFADGSTMIIDGTDGRITSPSVSISEFLQLPNYADDTARSAAITTPVQGMVVFMQNGTSPTVTNKPVFFNGTSWEEF